MPRRGFDQHFGRGKASRSQRDARRDRDRGKADAFVLYVEGPRDREILGCWARRVDHELARSIERNVVILGGRRPARAISDFKKRGGSADGRRGLIVLDRDDHALPDERAEPGSTDSADCGDENGPMSEEGLELFVWSQRHIESYLLVPAALRRMLGHDPKDQRIERFFTDTENLSESLHAKRVLGPGGSLSRVLGTSLRPGDIARAMRREDFHPDIHDLFERIGRALGRSHGGPEVVVRARS